MFEAVALIKVAAYFRGDYQVIAFALESPA